MKDNKKAVDKLTPNLPRKNINALSLTPIPPIANGNIEAKVTMGTIVIQYINGISISKANDTTYVIVILFN